MKYIINLENNRITFINSYSKGIITLQNNQAEITLIKVENTFRGLGYAKNLMKVLLNFIKDSLLNIQRVFLSPLPTDRYGLSLNELIIFYSKFNFKPSAIPPQYAPYMMERYL